MNDTMGTFARPTLASLGSIYLLFVVLPVSFFDAELLQSILKRSESKTKELGGFGDVVVRLLHRLRDEIALDVLEIDSFRR